MKLESIVSTRTRVWLISGVLLISLFAIILNFSNVWSFLMTGFSLFLPFIIAFFIAFLSAPLFRLITKLISKITHNKSDARVISAVLTLIVLVVFLAIFLMFVIPQLAASINNLISNLPDTFNRLNQFINSFELQFDIEQEASKWIDTSVAYISENITELLKDAYDILVGLWGNTINFIWGLILGVIFFLVLLIDRESLAKSMRRLTHSMFKTETANSLILFSRECSDIFQNYFLGQALDSVILAVGIFITMEIFNIPYSILISVVIMFTNMIPFFGPFLGAIPSIFIVMTVDVWLAFQLAIIILVGQQIDGNIISPRILGDTLKLPPVMILLSITVFGSLFGIIGMVFGVPVMAILYRLLKRWTDARLEKI